MKRNHRRAFECYPHPLQLRKLAVPESTEEWIQVQEKNPYGREEDWFQNVTRSRRPMSSVQILTSIIAAPVTTSTFDPHQAPIFQEFYEKIGFEGAAKSSALEETDENKNIRDDIDKSSLSSLSKGQHRRYLQLTSSLQTERRKENERKELRSLTSIVKIERSKYRQALVKYFEEHKDRFLAGFQSSRHPANPFCRWASNYQKEINHKWQNEMSLPMKYGKCFQVLSFPSRYSTLFGADTLHFEIVHETQVPSDMMASNVPSIGAQIKPPTKSSAKWLSWLEKDEVAIDFATKKGASILTSAETLETMLQLPGDRHTLWMLFAKTLKKSESPITVLDVPIAQPMMPRECLERGLREGIYQAKNDDKSIHTRYVYTLWTLPATTAAMRRQSIRVLVRSSIRMVDKDGIPISIRPHVEYFPERGMEETSMYEKSLWILDQLLFQQKVNTLMARVDSQTCKILDLEETSVAHALASVADTASNPILHWQTMIQIFQSLPSIGLSNFIMCLPGRDANSAAFSVSIHAPILNNAKACAVINLEDTLPQADAVVLNTEALLHCSRSWKWSDPERIPYTFPLKKMARTQKQ